MLRSLGLIEILVILCVADVIVVHPYGKIFAKAGFPGPLALLMLIPLLNVVMLFVLAFIDWPALKGSRQSG